MLDGVVTSIKRPRVRARKPKVRTGCITCKVRRIKCDEQKPECQKCTSTRRKCDGYATVDLAKRNSRRLISSCDASPYSIASYSLSFDISGNSHERRCLHNFYNRIAPELSGYFDSDFWNRLLPQVSHSEPAIKHAAIALSSLFEGFQLRGFSAQRKDEADGSHGFALKQYNKALGHLLRHVSAKDTHSIEVTLISCVLFICLELLQGSYSRAVSHLQSGIKILMDWRTRNNKSAFANVTLPSSGDHSMENDLVLVFTRLDTQAMFIGSTPARFHMISPYEDGKSDPGPCVKEAFTSLSEARHGLEIIMSKIFGFLGGFEDDPQIIADNPLVIGQNRILAKLESWKTAFESLVACSSAEMDSKDLREAVLLKLHYKTVYIMLLGGLESETYFDRFIPDFATINSLARSLIELPSSTFGPPWGKATFSLDMGIIPPLYYVALKCRDPTIRREAISLISSSPHKEGMWDPAVVTGLAKMTIAIEEQGREDITSAEDLPNSVRIRERGLSADSVERKGLCHYRSSNKTQESLKLNSTKSAWITW